MERNLRKTRVGKVVSNKMQKTIVVAIEDHVKHPLFVAFWNLKLKSSFLAATNSWFNSTADFAFKSPT